MLLPSGILRQGPRQRKATEALQVLLPEDKGESEEQTSMKHCVRWLCAQGPTSCKPPFTSSHNPVGQGISSTHLPDVETEVWGGSRTC